MYDAYDAFRSIDANTGPIMACLLITVAGAFFYFVIAFRMAIRQQVYVVPFIGAALFFWHAFINMGMVTGLLPVVGVPLPLFSYGGSSVVADMLGIGILLNVSLRRFMF